MAHAWIHDLDLLQQLVKRPLGRSIRVSGGGVQCCAVAGLNGGCEGLLLPVLLAGAEEGLEHHSHHHLPRAEQYTAPFIGCNNGFAPNDTALHIHSHTPARTQAHI